MELNSITLLGNSSIGIFGFATDTYAILPYNTDDQTLSVIESTINVPVIQTSINNSHLNGLFVSGNSHHLLVPHLISDLEYNNIDKQLPDDVSLHIIETTLTALGNVLVTTDDKALVSPEFNRKEKNIIGDILDVEVASKTILNTTIVGSLIFATETGVLTHPLVSDEDLDWLEDFFSRETDVVTVNRGTPYPRPGLIGNNNGVLVGSDTTGPELMRIFDVLAY